MSTDKPDSSKLAEVAFDDALNNMHIDADSSIDKLIASFEEVAHVDDDGVEYWTARDLQKLLDYTDYRNFLNIVSKAKDACFNSGNKVEDHFVDVNDMIEIGKGATREVDNIKLSRYASYLVAQSGDPRKEPVGLHPFY